MLAEPNKAEMPNNGEERGVAECWVTGHGGWCQVARHMRKL